MNLTTGARYLLAFTDPAADPEDRLRGAEMLAAFLRTAERFDEAFLKQK